MKVIPLKEYLDQKATLTQSQLSQVTGIGQGSISIMSRSSNDIYVRIDCWPVEIWEKRQPGRPAPWKRKNTKNGEKDV